MAIVGYARVSTKDQNLEAQITMLQDAGCERIFFEKKDGAVMRDRGELERCMHYIRDGDVLVVTRVDRLARSVVDFAKLMEELETRRVGFKCITQPFDTTSPSGRLMRDMLSAFAAFETAMRKERQMEGILAAKARGAYTGDKARKQAALAYASRLLREGKGFKEAARRTGVSDDTLRRRFPHYVKHPWKRGVLESAIQAEPELQPTDPNPPSAGEPVAATKAPEEPKRKGGLFQSLLPGR